VHRKAPLNGSTAGCKVLRGLAHPAAALTQCLAHHQQGKLRAHGIQPRQGRAVQGMPKGRLVLLQLLQRLLEEALLQWRLQQPA
jgi:hypothetical protein